MVLLSEQAIMNKENKFGRPHGIVEKNEIWNKRTRFEPHQATKFTNYEALVKLLYKPSLSLISSSESNDTLTPT